jgi:hypothetical protein
MAESRPTAEHLGDESHAAAHFTPKEATAMRRAFVVHYGWCCHRCLQSLWWRDEDGLVLLVERHLAKCREERHRSYD